MLITKTTWGVIVILAGANKKTGQYTGINVRFVEMSVYVFAGLFRGNCRIYQHNQSGKWYSRSWRYVADDYSGRGSARRYEYERGRRLHYQNTYRHNLLAILTNGLNIIGIPFYDQLIVQGILIFVGNGLAIYMSQKSEYAM